MLLDLVPARDPPAIDREELKKFLIAALQQCGGLEQARYLHSQVSQIFHSDQLLQNLLVKAYSDCRRVDLARDVFDQMPRRNVFSWNIMLAAYAQTGHLEEAEYFFRKMPRKDAVSWNSMIQALARSGNPSKAFRMFLLMDLEGLEIDRFAIAPVISSCSSLAMAERIHAVARDGGSDVGCLHVANELIKLYGRLGRPREAKKIFDSIRVEERDLIAAATMITAFSSNGHLSQALDLFHSTPDRNAAIWNAIISACAQSGRSKLAVSLLSAMDQRGDAHFADAITLVSAIDACSSLEEVRTVYGSISPVTASSTTEVRTALLGAYAKLGVLADARKIFEFIRTGDIVSWTAMITAYARNGRSDEALEIFRRMQQEGITPNAVTLSSVFHACAAAASLQKTRKIHAAISGSCGALRRVEEVFDRMPERNVVSWSSMVAAYAQCGHSRESLGEFRAMDLEGILPNEALFREDDPGLFHPARDGSLCVLGRFAGKNWEAGRSQGIGFGVLFGSKLLENHPALTKKIS